MLELQLLFPEKELLLDLLRQAESCAAKCKQILKSPISLKVMLFSILSLQFLVFGHCLSIGLLIADIYFLPLLIHQKFSFVTVNSS